MTRTSHLSPSTRSELCILDQEHSKIRRAYIELDESILHAHGSPTIIEIAERLVQMMLRHLVHEEQFVKKFCSSALLEGNQNGNAVAPELRQIQSGLLNRHVDAALQLRAVCKRWMSNHLHVETLEYEVGEKPPEGHSAKSQVHVQSGAEEPVFSWYPQADLNASAFPSRYDETKVTS